jgi:hypothetical protein
MASARRPGGRSAPGRWLGAPSLARGRCRGRAADAGRPSPLPAAGGDPPLRSTRHRAERWHSCRPDYKPAKGSTTRNASGEDTLLWTSQPPGEIQQGIEVGYAMQGSVDLMYSSPTPARLFNGTVACRAVSPQTGPGCGPTTSAGIRPARQSDHDTNPNEPESHPTRH